MPPSELLATFRATLSASLVDGDAALADALATCLACHPTGREGGAAFGDETALIAEVQRIRGRVKRDPLGWVATPPAVGAALFRLLATAYPEAWRAAKVLLDPAAGSGCLLAPAPKRMQQLGWELDPVAASMARALRPALSMDETDGLRARRPPLAAGRLAVVCNPPYVPAYARASQAGAMDVAALRTLTRGWSPGRQNLAIAFIARVVRDLLAPGEVAGFIVPDALLNGTSYAPFRRALRRHCDDVVVAHIGESVFAGRSVRAVLLGCRRASLPLLAECGSGCGVRFFEDASGWRVAGTLPPATADALPSGLWPWPRAATPLAFRLQQRCLPLSTWFDVADGVNPGPRAARVALLRDSPDALDAPRPVFEGRDIGRDGLTPPTRFIETRPDAWRAAWRAKGASLRAPGLFEGPRLYSRQTTSRLTVAYTEGPGLALNSAHVIRCRAGAMAGADVALLHPERTVLRRLAAILNTPSMTAVYQALFDEARAAFPQVKVTNLRALPLPWPLEPREPVDAAVVRTADRWAQSPTAEALHAVDAAVAMWLTARCSGGARRD